MRPDRSRRSLLLAAALASAHVIAFPIVAFPAVDALGAVPDELEGATWLAALVGSIVLPLSLVFAFSRQTGEVVQAFRHVSRTAGAHPLEQVPPCPGRVGVLLPAYAESAVVRKTIATLLAQRYLPARLQIIVIVDGSDDGTYSLARLTPAEAEVADVHVVFQENAKKWAALNHGLRLLGDDVELVCQLDADVWVEPTTITRLLRPILADPEVACVTGRCFIRNGTLGEWEWLQAAEYADSVGKHAESEAGAVWIPIGPLTLWRRSVLRQMTAFYEARGESHGGPFTPVTLAEDAEAGYTLRLLSAAGGGGKSVFVDEAIVETQGLPLEALIKQRRRWCHGLRSVAEHSFARWRATPGASWAFALGLGQAALDIVWPLLTLAMTALVAGLAVVAPVSPLALGWCLVFLGLLMVRLAFAVAIEPAWLRARLPGFWSRLGGQAFAQELVAWRALFLFIRPSDWGATRRIGGGA